MSRQSFTEEQAIAACIEMNERLAAIHQIYQAEKECLLYEGGAYAEFRDANKAGESVMAFDGLEAYQKLRASDDYKIVVQLNNKFLAAMAINNAKKDEIVSAWRNPPPREDLVSRISALRRELELGTQDYKHKYMRALERARAQGWKKPENSPAAKKIELSHRPAIVSLEKRIGPQLWLYQAKLAQLDALAEAKFISSVSKPVEPESTTDDENEPGAS